ncbi:hypothetical protein [Embleya scabrispora]|uniref:hypothetical protein n=1 Tax=Embleya scabrispora TaxID=159449 RepID=UPI0003693ABC|nr:hypothetical protein [Embleya scabrispora]MYS84612.1 glycosyl hydrolase [Streptomyces sp. SID5474]
MSTRTPLAPLITDPVFDGVTDPTLVRDHATGQWWCVFAHRRANVRLSGSPSIARCHGTPLGLASSTDQGASWLYRGTLDLPIEPGHNTFWGPTLVASDGTYHLFTTFIRGVPNDPAWDTHGRPSPWHRRIHHLSSTDMWHWQHHGPLELGTDHAVDPCVARTPDGSWSLWFKDEAAGGALRRVTGPDLMSWSPPETVLSTWHESPVVFRLGGFHWLIAESRNGLTSYRSTDALAWEETGPFVARTGIRPSDAGSVRSPDVVRVDDSTAYLVYYTQSGHDSFGDEVPTSSQSSVAQVALLRVENGGLTCDRDAPFEFRLP